MAVAVVTNSQKPQLAVTNRTHQAPLGEGLVDPHAAARPLSQKRPRSSPLFGFWEDKYWRRS